MQLKQLPLLLFLLLWSSVSMAQSTLLKAGGYVDVEAGQLITPANIVVSDGIITSVNPKSLPDNADIIDLGDAILLPGFMDMHTHLTLDFEGSWEYVAKENASKAAIRGAKNAALTLMSGFTTVRDVGQVHITKELINVALAEAIDEGLIVGPRIIASGHMVSITGGHGDPSLTLGFTEGTNELTPEYGIVNSPDDAVEAVRYQIKHGAKVIKIHATAGVLSAEKAVGAQQLSDAEIKAAVEEASRHDIPVAAHAHGTEGIKAAIEAGVTSIEHGSILDDEAIQMLIDHEVFLVPTTGLLDRIDMTSLPDQFRKKAEYVFPFAQEGLSNAIDAGVKIALGSDVPVFPHGQNAYEIVAMVDRGMTPAQSLRSATLIASELIGMQQELGQIKEGMIGDIVAVSENPLENIETVENVIFVMKDGVVYKMEE